MIYSHTPVPNIIENELITLINSEHTFYPTGSRVFNHATTTQKTDYDFFTTEDAIPFLIKNKYSKYGVTHTNSYYDQNTKAVFSKRVGVTHIDVQVVTDLRMKLTVQKAILKHRIFLCHLSKTGRTVIWRMMNDLYLGVKHE